MSISANSYEKALKKLTDDYKNNPISKSLYSCHDKDPSTAKLNDHLLDFRFNNKIRIYNAIRENADELNINRFNIEVRDLKKISKSKFLECRNVGIGMLLDLELFCIQAGIEMKD